MAALARRAVKDGKIWRDYPDTPMPSVATSVLRQTDELDAAERGHDEYLSIVGSHGSWATVGEAWERGELAFMRGDVAEAEAAARTAVEIAREAGFLLAFPPWLALLVEVLVERDDLAGAEAELGGRNHGSDARAGGLPRCCSAARACGSPRLNRARR